MHLNSNNAGRSKVSCISCARNKHKNCDLHMNDGAFDAEDFISVSCSCFCRGRIGTQFDSLMAMAKHYAEQVEEFQEETRQVRMLAARAAGVADEVMEIVRNFDARARDDEGNLMVSSRREHVDRVLDEFFLHMKAVASKSEAVLALLAEDSGFNTKDLVDKMTELQERAEEDAEDSLPLFLPHDQRKFVVTEPGGNTRDATPGEVEMIEQHERAQAIIAERAMREADDKAGWPVD